MLYRKITSYIEDYLKSDNDKILILEYNVLAATVISNERKVYQEGKVTYMPVYFVMFFDERSGRAERMEADTPQTDEEEYFF